jgi:hypothetical protein
MARKRQLSSDDAKLEEARRHLDELLKDPAEFEKWANETLDMSRMRRR